jgi:hypothetical protein
MVTRRVGFDPNSFLNFGGANDGAWDRDYPFEDKLQAALIRILMAPEFLFLVEAVPPSTPRGNYRLTDWELASRLSYFLTGTMPDKELHLAAERGDLNGSCILVLLSIERASK